MSELDSLVEKAEIKFPRAIDSKEVKSLMMLLAEKLPASIGYSCKVRGDIKPNGKPHELKSEESDLKFEGSIRRDSNLATAFFELGRAYSHEKSGRYDYLKFHALPGCLLGNDQNEVEIWDNVRGLIEKYFS